MSESILGYRAELVLYDEMGRRLHVDNFLTWDGHSRAPGVGPSIDVGEVVRAMEAARTFHLWDKPATPTWRVEQP